MKEYRSRFAPVSLAVLLTTVLLTASVAVASDKVLYSFKGGDDGANPSAGLVADRFGNLYGTTDAGGRGACTEGCGTVFVLSPDPQNGNWTKSTIYSFNGTDGAAPQARLIFDNAGNLYGTAAGGGPAGDGIVFKLAPPAVPGTTWTLTALYKFAGGNDGAYPLSGLVFDTAGNLYGTTLFGGGPPQGGIVFQLAPPAVPGGDWTESVLYRFTYGSDGANPETGVLVDQQGALYGSTRGPSVVFKLIPPSPGQESWTFRSLYQFHGSNDGSELNDIIAGRGAIFGSATIGGNANHGTVYQLSPQAGLWKETTLYNFQGGNDGGLPEGPIFGDPSGKIYGTTYSGGQADGGTVFRLSRSADGSWTKTTLHDFVAQGDGRTPNGGVIKGKGGALYGTTYAGGAYGQGAIFAVAP